ncbi:MAG: polysaccharide biosynthesis C-terminal domain-containing protein, partial [Spirochaetota bacterium]
PIVKIVLGDQWLSAVPFLQLFALNYAFKPINTTNLQAIAALGRSDLFLKIEIIKKVFGIIVIIISIPFGIYAIAGGTIISTLFYMIVNTYYMEKLINYSYIEQFKDVIVSFILAILMSIFVYLIKDLTGHIYLDLSLQFITGLVSYIVLAIIFNHDAFYYLIDSLKNLIISYRKEFDK